MKKTIILLNKNFFIFKNIKSLYLDTIKLIETKFSALACSTLFNFGDSNPIRVKYFLQNYNLKVKIAR